MSSLRFLVAETVNTELSRAASAPRNARCSESRVRLAVAESGSEVLQPLSQRFSHTSGRFAPEPKQIWSNRLPAR